MANILIADDDPNISSLLADSLQDEGYSTVTVSDGDNALQMAQSADFDLILLDIMMPGKTGLEVCQKIRDTISCPIIFVTAKGRTLDTVLGLEIGADDYISKPFIVEELIAKVKANLRREQRHTASSAKTIFIGDLQIHSDSLEVSKDGIPVPLTTREFQLLVYLAEHTGKVLTREQLFDAIWGMDYSDIGSVTVTIKNLRDKLDPDNRMIKTVWGVGYKLVRPGLIP
ncbi:response regulator transcription factor [Eubacteriaceae bacterium ES2]|nr:response regulator transcription factor [Eubacteriaceae bacterium ES2]